MRRSAVRAREGFVSLPTPCGDQGVDTRVHPAFLVAREDGHTANQKKLFFNLRKAKSRISALDEVICTPTR